MAQSKEKQSTGPGDASSEWWHFALEATTLQLFSLGSTTNQTWGGSPALYRIIVTLCLTADFF